MESCEKEPGNINWVPKAKGWIIKHPLLKDEDVRKKGKLKKISSFDLPGLQFLLLNGMAIQSLP